MSGSAARWRANGWKRGNFHVVPNADLWRRLLALCRIHEVEFVWVKGHAGNVENERCDALATAAARADNLPADDGYERMLARAASQPTLFE